MKKLFVALLCLLSVFTPAAAQDNAPAYWLAFHACDETSCRDPRQHQVYLAQSDDGVFWELVPGWEPFPGSVPDVIRRGDTLYIYTAFDELVRYHLDTGVQDAPVRVQVEGLQRGFVDPSLILDDNGNLVLFMLSTFVPNGDPARCPAGEGTCQKEIDSASEVEGSDGERFTLDSGHRALPQLGPDTFESASDPDIFFDGDQFVLYISHGMTISVWTAPTLQDSYEQLGILSDNRGGIAAGYFDAEHESYWTYAHIFRDGVNVIRRAVHDTLDTPLDEEDWEIVVSAGGIGLDERLNVESPSFAVNTPL